jgi:hypothetical protein
VVRVLAQPGKGGPTAHGVGRARHARSSHRTLEAGGGAVSGYSSSGKMGRGRWEKH